ncbi:MAG: hypothetical protein ACOZF2_12495 [Thermodesulfobacteriota bacterium]
MKVHPHRRLLVAISLLLFLIFLETLSFGVGVFLSRYGKIYRPHVTESYATYAARLNPLLGWPSTAAIGSVNLDSTGSRINPAYPDPASHPNCVSIYGDSFAWSDEVDAVHAWGNVLSKLLKCRVANFGIGGYGTDQAYLRFKTNRRDPARIVIMVFSSDNIRRHVNRVRNFIIPGPQLGTKPRFLLDAAGQLQLIPLPKFNLADYDAFIKAPSPYLSHEFFLPGGPSGIQALRFPYTLALLKSAPLLFSRWRQGTPQYFDFFKRNHPSGALDLTLAIMQAFHREAAARGKVSLIVLVPTFYDQLYFQKHGRWVYQEMLDYLGREKINYLNLGPGILAYLGSRYPGDIFQGPGGHFTEEGYKLMAQLVYDKMSALLGHDLPGLKP